MVRVHLVLSALLVALSSAASPAPSASTPKPLLPGVPSPTSSKAPAPSATKYEPGTVVPPSEPEASEAPTASSAAPEPSSAAPPPAPAPVPAPALPPAEPNWVGPIVGKPSDSACYRKTYISSNKQCGVGYSYDNIKTCWAQCPIEYPVQCGMECIPQNKDCTKEILKKVESVVNVALNAATGGVFGTLTKAAKGVQVGVRCGQQLFSVTKQIISIVDQAKATVTTKDKVLATINNSDFVIYDLPAAIATCIGVPIPSGLNKAKEVTGVVQNVVNSVVDARIGGLNLLDFKTFLNVTKSAVPKAAASIGALSKGDTSSLMTLVSGSSCGADINSVVNRVTAMVQDMKNKDPATPVGALKTAVLNSNFVLQDLPRAASSCASAVKRPGGRELAATSKFLSRDQIIKSVHVMIDSIVGASNKGDKPQSVADFGLAVANMGLDAIALIDPTGIAAMASEFLQPICGPTAYVGQIDDGPADQAVGLNAIQKAFRDSTGTWKKKGNGQLKITFKSVDDKDVTVNVMSGGSKKYNVKVKKGQTVEWSKPLSEFQGKTLYLDRWRAGILGFSGTGGGSLLAWVPDNKDGELVLNVQINPTSLKNHGRRLDG